MSVQSKFIGALAAMSASVFATSAFAEVAAAAVVVSPVPEPGTWALMGLGVAVVAFVGKNRRK